MRTPGAADYHGHRQEAPLALHRLAPGWLCSMYRHGRKPGAVGSATYQAQLLSPDAQTCHDEFAVVGYVLFVVRWHGEGLGISTMGHGGFMSNAPAAPARVETRGLKEQAAHGLWGTSSTTAVDQCTAGEVAM